jgi:hypothetical protein
MDAIQFSDDLRLAEIAHGGPSFGSASHIWERAQATRGKDSKMLFLEAENKIIKEVLEGRVGDKCVCCWCGGAASSH